MGGYSIMRDSIAPKPKSRLFENSVFLTDNDLWSLLLIAEKAPSLSEHLRGRKINTMLVAEFLLAEAEERAKGWIHEEWLTFQVLHCNSDGTRIEHLPEELSVRHPALWCCTHTKTCIAPFVSKSNLLSKLNQLRSRRYSFGIEFVPRNRPDVAGFFLLVYRIRTPLGLHRTCGQE